jgi:endonuclease-8
MPEGDTLFRTAAGLRPYLVGRTVTAARTGGIRFDNGLEVRTHLRMNGSWHRYRPGERWRRPPGRARLVIEVPGAVAVCFDAPVVELLEQRAEALHPALGRLGPDLLAPEFDAGEALRRLRDPSRAAMTVAEALLDQRAMAGIGNVYKSELLWIERVSPFAAVVDLDDATIARLVASGRRLLLENVKSTHGPERVTTRGDRGAPGPLYVYGRTGRPCRRCRTPIASQQQGSDLPRTTYWCPACQGGPG